MTSSPTFRRNSGNSKKRGSTFGCELRKSKEKAENLRNFPCSLKCIKEKLSKKLCFFLLSPSALTLNKFRIAGSQRKLGSNLFFQRSEDSNPGRLGGKRE